MASCLSVCVCGMEQEKLSQQKCTAKMDLMWLTRQMGCGDEEFTSLSMQTIAVLLTVTKCLTRMIFMKFFALMQLLASQLSLETHQTETLKHLHRNQALIRVTTQSLLPLKEARCTLCTRMLRHIQAILSNTNFELKTYFH